MLEKIASYDKTDHFLRLSKRAALIVAILLVIGVAFMLMALYRGSVWLYANYTTWRQTDAVAFMSPFERMKNYFQSNRASEAVPNPTQIVGEEARVIEVVRKASPAVVSIVASAEEPVFEQCYQQSPISPDIPPEFQQFFDFRVPSLCQRGTEQRRVGAGSGFIVSPDGYIVTNKHVVADERGEYTVFLNDEKNLGKKLKAQVVARAPNDDIAILKIEATNLPALTFGDSSKLKVGQTAIAIGYALGEFDNSVSKGVVSGLARSINAVGDRGVEQLRGLIQTDAAINPGNSGGPLLDSSGNVIGVSVAMANAQSIGFAIPSNQVKKAFDQARQTGKIVESEQPFLGVRYAPITSELQKSENLPYDYGMLVGRGDGPGNIAVVPGSPADKAGIEENDIILEVNGKQLNERYLLADALAAFKPGDEVELKIFHKGEEKTMRVKLAKR